MDSLVLENHMNGVMTFLDGTKRSWRGQLKMDTNELIQSCKKFKVANTEVIIPALRKRIEDDRVKMKWWSYLFVFELILASVIVISVAMFNFTAPLFVIEMASFLGILSTASLIAVCFVIFLPLYFPFYYM
jgi:hypothetical protein